MLYRNMGRFTLLTCACVLAVACGIELLRPASSSCTKRAIVQRKAFQRSGGGSQLANAARSRQVL